MFVSLLLVPNPITYKLPRDKVHHFLRIYPGTIVRW